MGIFENAVDGILDYFKSLGKNDWTSAIQNAGQGIDKIVIKNNHEIITKDKPTKNSNALDLKGEKEVKALVKQASFSLRQRKDLLSTLYKMRANDVVETIIDVMVDDGLVSGNNNKIFEKISYKGETSLPEIEAQIEILKKRIKPDRMVLDFIEEALLLGEYMLPIVIEEGTRNGIMKVLDNADMENMLCVYEGTEKKYFLRKNGNSLEKLDKNNYIHFVTNPKKLRVQVKDFHNFNKDEYILPQYIKVGKSIIYPVINKIKQLQTLEMANLASDLREILKPTIIQVGMPEKTTPDKIGEIIERYEMIFSNIFASLQDVEELNFSDLLSVITTIKVVPSGGDGRGSFVKPDLNPNSTSAEKEQMIRRSIALTVGIPFYYLSVNDNPTQRLEALKLFSRYARKLNNMQDCIIDGVKEMIKLHIKYTLGITIDTDDIEISMREIVNIELLDRMEYLVALMTGLEEIIKLVSTVEESIYLDIGVNSKILLEILNKNLGEFQGYSDLFVFKDKSRLRSQQQEQGNFPSEKKENNLGKIQEKKGEYENIISNFTKPSKKSIY